MAEGTAHDAATNGIGNTPSVTENLDVTNRAVSDVSQAIEVCEGLIGDWEKGVKKAGRITAKINGERPYSQKALKDNGKGHKTNISTGFLQTECGKILPRFYMPLKSSKYLTAASLPLDWPDGEAKSAYFRQVITETIRRWPKFNFYVRGLAREVGVFGFGFNVWFDELEWRPTLVRMDRGFVPAGSEVMETELPFFVVKYDYKPHELLALLRASVEAGREEWKKDNVLAAINTAVPPKSSSASSEARSYEELVRQSIATLSYRRGARLIPTYHLFAKEATGSVSHYVLLAEAPANHDGEAKDEIRLLYERLDEFPAMADAVSVTVFDYGDGTIHGSLGAGHILYDLSVQVEKVRCDAIDNMRMTNKLKLQVPEAKNVGDVKLHVNEEMVISAGATFAGNTAALTPAIEGYEVLDQKLTQIAQQKIGAFVPPIPLQPSDIKAAQINAELMKEREMQEALLENWLMQCAILFWIMTKRLCNPQATDSEARRVQKQLIEKLTEEEVALLANQFPIQSVMEFTEYASQKRAAFAAAVKGDPLFRQTVVARVMAEGAGDEKFVREITVPDGDQSEQARAVRAQTLENTAFEAGNPVPVLPEDSDWVHMETQRPYIKAKIDQGNIPAAQLAIQHYAAHWGQGVAKKTIPKDQINAAKGFIASVEKAIEALREQAQIRQAATEAQAQASDIAQKIVAAEAGTV
jgi:hypothetical protein